MKNTMIFSIGDMKFDVSVTDIDRVKAAYNFMMSLYQNRQRDNGDPFWWHPVSTIWIMQDWFRCKLTDDIIVIALLHDALWVDFSQTQNAILKQFGEDVLIAVTLLTKPHIIDKRSKQKEDEEVQFNKIVQYGSEELLLIKYAERLHNMMDLHKTDYIKQKRFLNTTKQLYIDRFPKDAGINDIVQTIFKEKYYEVIDKLNIQV